MDPDSTPAEQGEASGPSAPRSRRRRRRRSGRRRSHSSPARVQRSLQPRTLDPSLPADEPLTSEEVAEMKRHLRFLSEHRRVLKLRVNAAEDLLLNGARQPEHRGMCVHLLSKVDHASIVKVLARLPDGAARSRFLGGAVRFSTDPGVLLLFLESLSDVAGRKAAAGGFSRAVQRLDFAEIGESRMRRVLELVATIFTDSHQRAQVVFGLLQSPSFRVALASAMDGLSPELSQLFESLSVAREIVIEGKVPSGSPAAVRAGVLLLISAPEDSLRAYPEDIRVRLLHCALDLMGEVDEAERAVAALLESLPHTGDEYRVVALRRARELLRLQLDVRARWQLRQVRAAQPNCREASDLLAAIDGARFGRMALGWPGGGKQRKGRGGGAGDAGGASLRRAFWLDHQSRVWLRTGDKKDSGQFAREAELLRPLVLGGLATLLVQDVAEGGKPFIVTSASGDPDERPLDKSPREFRTSLWLARQGLMALAALHNSGRTIPDAHRKRFLVGGGKRPLLSLADFSGIKEVDSEQLETRLSELSHRWCRDLLSDHLDALSSSLRTFVQRGGVSAREWARALAVQLSR